MPLVTLRSQRDAGRFGLRSSGARMVGLLTGLSVFPFSALAAPAGGSAASASGPRSGSFALAVDVEAANDRLRVVVHNRCGEILHGVRLTVTAFSQERVSPERAAFLPDDSIVYRPILSDLDRRTGLHPVAVRVEGSAGEPSLPFRETIAALVAIGPGARTPLDLRVDPPLVSPGEEFTVRVESAHPTAEGIALRVLPAEGITVSRIGEHERTAEGGLVARFRVSGAVVPGPSGGSGASFPVLAEAVSEQDDRTGEGGQIAGIAWVTVEAAHTEISSRTAALLTALVVLLLGFFLVRTGLRIDAEE